MEEYGANGRILENVCKMEIPGTLEKCTDSTLTLAPISFLRCPQFARASTLNLYILSAPVQLECVARIGKENVSALRLVRFYLGSERPHTTRFISFYWKADVFVVLEQCLQLPECGARARAKRTFLSGTSVISHQGC